MKKHVFTLLIMLALVALTGKVFAQGTAMTPFEGSTHTYVVNGLTPGDSYQFGINTTPGVYTTVAGNYTVSTSTPLSGVLAAGVTTATIEVFWGAGSALEGPYNVWIQITDAPLGCSTYRYLPVTPINSGPYAVNYSIEAVTTDSDLTTTGWTTITTTPGSTSVEDCPGFVNENWLSTTEGAGSATDGYTYAYFRITRTSTFQNIAWEITPNATAPAGTTWQYTVDGVTFTTFTMNSQITPINNDIIYLRAYLANTTSEQVITVTITGGNDIVPTQETATHTPIAPAGATLTIDPLPAVGSFDSSN
jgi:hypothetical protein